MPRIRSIKHTFFSDEKLAEYSPMVRLTFAGLIAYADDDGRLKGDPRLIKSWIWPLDDEMTAAQVAKHLEQLADGHDRRIDWYQVAGRWYIEVRNFKRHQYIQRAKPSEYPAPTGVMEAYDTSTIRVSDEYQQDGKGVDGMGMDGNGTKARTTKPSAPKAAAVKRATWLTPYADLWRKHYGGDMPTGPAIRPLAKLRAEHGDEETLRRWDNYLANTSGAYANAARFAATWATWAEATPRSPPGTRKLSAAEQSIENSRIAFGLKPP